MRRRGEGWKVYHDEAYKNNMEEAGAVVLALSTYKTYIFDLVILSVHQVQTVAHEISITLLFADKTIVQLGYFHLFSTSLSLFHFYLPSI